jgi:hypothetical protein
MPHSDTGERVTPVLEFPSRDGLVVQAIRVDYEPAGFTRGTHRHPAGAYVYVIEGRRVVLRAAGRAALRVAQRQPGAAGEPDRVLRARRGRVRDRLQP